SGALTTVQFKIVSSGTNVFTQSLAGAANSGAPLTVTLRARDGSNNVASATYTYRLPDRRAPLLTASDPVNGSVRQSLWNNGVLFRFDEPLDPATVTTNNVLFTNAIAATVSLENNNRDIRIRPSAFPLSPGTEYAVQVSQLADLAGNVVADSLIQFTTAAILAVAPTNSSRAVPGQLISVQV